MDGIALEFDEAEKSDEEEANLVREDDHSDAEDENVLKTSDLQSQGPSIKLMTQEWINNKFKTLTTEPIDFEKIVWKLLEALCVEES